jgi:AraC-like DNA-binding protein
MGQTRLVGFSMAHLVLHSDGDEEHGGLIAICSRVTLSLRRMQNLFDIVREPMLESATSETPVGAPLERLLQELAAPGPGNEAMVRALLQQSLLELMRQRLSDGGDNLNWMAALRDPALWPVLQEMLDTPGADHSVESLADTATMSRSVFAERFAKAYGSGPMELLRELRMRLAATLLADTSTPVKRVAALAGFQSRSAFTRAFTERTGEPPADFRQSRKPAE